MTQRTFVAFSSSDPIVSDAITAACEMAKIGERESTRDMLCSFQPEKHIEVQPAVQLHGHHQLAFPFSL